jgi:hypothetical protein
MELGPNQHAFLSLFLQRWGELIADSLPEDIFDPAGLEDGSPSGH